MERQSRSLPWQAGETSSGPGERVVFLTTPCITLEAFVETKVMCGKGKCVVVR